MRTKEEKEQRKIEKEQRRQMKAEKAARKMSIQAAADNSTGALLEQVSQKLAANDAAISAVQAPEAPKAPERRRESLLEKSAANVTNSTNVAQTSTANAIQTQKRAEVSLALQFVLTKTNFQTGKVRLTLPKTLQLNVLRPMNLWRVHCQDYPMILQ